MKNILFLVSIFFALISDSNAQNQNCYPWLKDFATSFKEFDKTSFTFFDDKLDNVRIVGIGENNHGTAEFTELPVQLMLYLAEEKGYRIFFIESSFGEVTYFNDYINSKRDDIDYILKEINSTWRYKTVQFLRFLNLLRQYNETNPTKAIQLFGVEMHYPKYDVIRLNEYLKNQKLPLIEASFEKHLYQDYSDDELSDMMIDYLKVVKKFNENRETLRSESDEDYFIASVYLDIVRQFITTLQQRNGQITADFRDRYMEINLSRILNYYGNEAKALFYAHNSHIGDWIHNGNVDVAGHFLKKRYGQGYFNLALLFGTGNYIAFPHNADEIGWNLQTHHREKVLENTFHFCLQILANPNVFLDLKKMKSNDEYRFLIEKPLVLMQYAGARKYFGDSIVEPLGKAFDGVLFLGKINPIDFLN